MIKYVCIAIFSGIISAFAQVMLKKSALNSAKAGIREYLNPYVIGGYGLTAVCMLLMVAAYRGMPFKYGAILESLVYFYVMILSWLFFHEKLTRKRIFGNLIIVLGVAVFSL